MKSFYHYWGKSSGRTGEDPLQYHLLAYHCLDVAAVGRTLLVKDPYICEKIISPLLPRNNESEKDRALNTVSFLLSLHDIGKFSERFQSLRPDIMEKFPGLICENAYTVYHDDMGRLLFEEDFWKQVWAENWFGLDLSCDLLEWKEALRPWIFAVTGHHGKPPERPKNDLTVRMLFDAEDRSSALTFAEASAGLFLKRSTTHEMLEFSDEISVEFHRTSWLLAGLAVLSDWIGSDTTHFPFSSEPMALEKYWEMYALPRAESAIQDAGILPARISEKTGMTGLFPAIHIPTPLQSHVSACELGESRSPRLFIIEEATGSGKTEAALVLAQRLIAAGMGEGIFFGLPTMATADAMYGRLEQAYLNLFRREDRPSLILAHSSRNLSKNFRGSIVSSSPGLAEPDRMGEMSASAQCAAWLSDNRKKSLLAQVGVGTIDQALMGVLPLRHQSLRLLGLSRNILIVDEVHAYDPYVHKVLETLLEFHAAQGGSAILLSATLPQKQRQELVAGFCKGIGIRTGSLQKSEYPLITCACSDSVSEIPLDRCEQTPRTINVACVHDTSAVKALLSEAVTMGQCACWVRNTVDDAIESYRELSRMYGEENVTLFHARFAMGDRLKIEHDVLAMFGKESILEMRRGKILVATQVVEQSLDLDFDLMITDLAPMDLIIQRAGRLHRHNDPIKRGNRGTPRLILLTPYLSKTTAADWYSAMFPKGAYVYPHHGQLWLTARILADRKKITMPDDARLLIEGVFSDEVQGEIPKSLALAEIQSDGIDMGKRAQANLNELKLDEGYRNSAGTPWMDDARTPTRLGEPRITVLLLTWDGSHLSFWFSSSEFSREMSQVSISEHTISKELQYSGKLGIALEQFKETLPDKGRWQVLVPLNRDIGEWSGSALNGKGNRMVVRYDPKTGLVVNKS